MTDRFRYLPCAWHEALAQPDWAAAETHKNQNGSPYRRLMPWHGTYIDLSHPAGWDHAVRAYAGMVKTDIPVDESMSVGFCYDPLAYIDHEDSRTPTSWWRLVIDGNDDVLAAGVPENVTNTHAGRREALCRAICTALGLDVDVVFPMERA